jgi:hypothetical protein
LKLVIDLIPVKHNMPKDLYQSKKIVVGLRMDYEKIDAYKKNYMLFWIYKDDTGKSSGRLPRSRMLRMRLVTSHRSPIG